MHVLRAFSTRSLKPANARRREKVYFVSLESPCSVVVVGKRVPPGNLFEQNRGGKRIPMRLLSPQFGPIGIKISIPREREGSSCNGTKFLFHTPYPCVMQLYCCIQSAHGTIVRPKRDEKVLSMGTHIDVKHARGYSVCQKAPRHLSPLFSYRMIQEFRSFSLPGLSFHFLRHPKANSYILSTSYSMWTNTHDLAQ